MALAASSTTGSGQGPEPGISRELARSRANLLSNISYQLVFDLEVGMNEVRGQGTIEFSLPDGSPPDAPVILDFGGESISELTINGVLQDEIGLIENHVILPAEDLDPGANQVSASFTSRVAPTGTPLTVFRDEARGEEFVYTLVVPADAHRLFPCFDQPDLKASLRLTLDVPADWAALANAPLERQPEGVAGGKRRHQFAPTEPLSTYLMAFAAGPFEVLRGGPANEMRAYVRRSQLEYLEERTLFEMHARSVAWLGDYFAREYPFTKLDFALLPGFPYGGMEHAGAIFYRESALAFDHEPTIGELLRRSTLIYHEVSHQWFGNLVTMEWFDDLWLKEGFATFVAYLLLDELEPERLSWLRFHQNVKPIAYQVDATPGTTPIYQELANLADAKSAYGAIVYNKAPAVLRELHERIGPEAFRDGVRLFLRRHAFANASWEDMVGALEQASGSSLEAWSDAWILSEGMPRVRIEWTLDENGRIASCDLVQRGVQPTETTWPMQVDLLWIDASGERWDFTVRSTQERTPIDEAIGRSAPTAVLPNSADIAYGQFLLDASSQDHWLANVATERDPVRAAVALTCLFDTVREAELEPQRLAETLLDLLEHEQDAASHAILLERLATIAGRYVSPEVRSELIDRATVTLLAQLESGMPGRELQTFRFLAANSNAPATLDLCSALLDGTAETAGLTLGEQDRYLALAALIAAGRAGERTAAMTGDATPAGSEKHAFVALAATPDPEVKASYFQQYLDPDQPPEQWIQASLATFHWAGQDDLTLPYLQRALERMEWVKTHRRIFFMPAWIDEFVNGHSDRRALDIVEAFLVERAPMPDDIEKKLQQSLDGLRRAVAIRTRWL